MTSPNELSDSPYFEYEGVAELIGQDRELLIDMLDESIIAAVPGQEFIDVSLEEHFPLVPSFVENLVRTFNGELDEEAYQAGYHAFHYAHSFSSLVLAGPAVFSVVGLFDGLEEENDEREIAKEELEATIEVFLFPRPVLSEITRYYMPAIDKTGRHKRVAELIAGSTFMFIDNGERLRAIDEHVADFAVGLDDLRLDGFES